MTVSVSTESLERRQPVYLENKGGSIEGSGSVRTFSSPKYLFTEDKAANEMGIYHQARFV